MITPEKKDQTAWTDAFNDIKNSNAPEVEKVARAFRWLADRYLEHAQGEIELFRAMNDRESRIKEQIKMETIKHALGMFHDCYKFMVGRRAWDE